MEEKTISQEELFAKFREAGSPEGVMALAKENGVTVSEETAKKMYESAMAMGELSDDELAEVSGGCIFCDIGEGIKKAAKAVEKVFTKDVPEAFKLAGEGIDRLLKYVKCPSCGSINTKEELGVSAQAGGQYNYKCCNCGYTWLH